MLTQSQDCSYRLTFSRLKTVMLFIVKAVVNGLMCGKLLSPLAVMQDTDENRKGAWGTILHERRIYRRISSVSTVEFVPTKTGTLS